MLIFPITRVLTKIIEGQATCIFFSHKVLFICLILSVSPSMIYSETAKVLIIDDFHPIFSESLSIAGIEHTYKPDIDLNYESDILKSFSIIALRSKMQMDQATIESLPKLKCIARGGAGMDNIDEAYALSKDITLLNAPEGNRDAVAEHCIGLLLAMSNNILKSSNEIKSLEWNRESNRGWEIGDKTIGIIGYGNTGSSFARKLSSFGCTLIAYDKYIKDVDAGLVEFVGLETLLKQADVISFHIPLNKETKDLLNSELIHKMKDQVVLINSSRGGICKTQDVWNGIESGKIKSFASDVFEQENMDKLTEEQKELVLKMSASNQVVLTPHIAGWSNESYKKIAQVLAQKIIEYTTKVKNI
jgi:D-3-phosphoglycerate dehydrogenase